jgi:hypothetical protein
MAEGFREHLKRHEEFGPCGEGQQQNLRVYFGGIYGDVRELLVGRIKRLESRYAKTKGAALKAELSTHGKAKHASREVEFC